MLYRNCVVALGVMLAASPAWANKDNPLAYLHTSGNLNGDAPSTWGFNAFDGKPTTAWCSGNDDKEPSIRVGLARNMTITAVSVVVGLLKGDKLDTSRGRVRELVMNDGQQKIPFTFDDKPEAQVLQLQSPVLARRLSFTVKDRYPGSAEGSPVCIAEIGLMEKDTELLGENVSKQVRGVTRPVLALAGVWVDEPSAPERFLTLSMDGAFTWSFQPLMEGEPAKVVGTWDAAGGKINVKPRGGKPFSLRTEREKVASKRGTYEQLTLDGKGGHDKLPGNYQPRAEN